MVCVLYLYFNSRYARRRLTFCGHFDYTLRCWLNLSCREDRKGHPNGPKEYKKNRSALFLSFNLYIFILHILYYIVGGRVTRQNNRRRHHHHHHHLFVYYRLRERLSVWNADAQSLYMILILERAELWKKKKRVFLNFFLKLFNSLIDKKKNRRKSRHSAQCHFRPLWQQFLLLFLYIHFYCPLSWWARGARKNQDNIFFLFGKEREEKRREKQVQQ